MQRHYVLLAMMLLFNQDVVSSHILTSTKDLPLPTCMRLLAFSLNELCEVYGGFTDETYDPPYTHAREMELRRNDVTLHTIKRCCMEPCTLVELMSVC